jgi:hypothetical protein
MGVLCAVSMAGQPREGCGDFLLLSHHERLVDIPELALELDADPYPELIPTTVSNGVFQIVQTNEYGELRSGPRINYPAASTAVFELAFDLEGDGDTDLLYSTIGGGQTGIMLFLNDGEGGFTLPFGLQPTPRMTYFHAEDLTGNGILDLLGMGTSTGVYRLSNVGVQGYEIEQLTDLSGMSLGASTFGDLDGDGDTDLVASSDPGLVTFYMQDDGSLLQAMQATPGQRMTIAQQVDIDLDGDPDLIGGVDDVLYIVRNDGVGAWTLLRTYTHTGPLAAIEMLDVNGDQYSDFILTAGPFSGRSSVLYVGIPGSPHFLERSLGSDAGASIGVGDFDGDGIDEFALASGNTVRTFQLASDDSLTQTSESTAFREARFGLVADLQNDNDPDLLVTRQGDIYQVLLNEQGAFRQSMYEIGTGASGVELADMNGDGVLDAITLSSDDRLLSVLIGRGGGYFDPPDQYLLEFVPTGFEIGDLDADGATDVVVIGFESGTANLMFNNGNGVFTHTEALDVRDRPTSVAIGDVNNNGHPDVVFTNQLSPQRVGVTMGFGSRVFFPPIPYATLNTASDLALDDVNSDGYLDIITVGIPTGGVEGRGIAIIENNALGFGTFAAPVGFDGSNRPSQIELGDLNNDGLSDLVLLGQVAGDSDIQFRVLLADGSGGYVETRRWDTGVDVPSDVPIDVELMDRDQDGDLDAFVWLANYSVFNVPYRFLINDSMGELNATTDPVSEWLGVGLFASGDVTGDGKSDLIFMDSVQGVLGTIHNGCESYCRPDLDLNGGINFFDVSLFLSGFTGELSSGDWNQDGAWDFFDISAFLSDYNTGCP